MPGAEIANSRREIAIAFLALVVSLYISSHTVADPDLWGHVRFGQDILAHGSVARIDPYSYLSAGQEWVNHEWLSEVAFAAVFNGFGPQGLLALKILLLLGTLGLVYRHLRAEDAGAVATAAVILLIAMLMEVGSRTVRPQLFTYFFFVLVLLVMHRADRGRMRSLWLLPPIFAAWANFHGGFLAGLGLLAVWSSVSIAGLCYGAIRERRPLLKPCGRIVLPAIASVLAIALNPFGLRVLVFLRESMMMPRPNIMEWAPIHLGHSEGIVYLAMVGLSIAAIVTTPQRRSPALMAALACTAVLPLMALRHLPLFALAAGVLAGEHIGAAWKQWLPPGEEHGSQPGPSPLRWAMSLLPLTTALLFCGATWHGSTRFWIDPQHGTYPVRAVQVLKASGAHGNMAVHFNWGQYAIWHLGPAIKVSYDGRFESVYNAAMRSLNADWVSGQGHWDALLDRYPTTLALLDKGLPAYDLMRRKAGWKLVYEDPLAALFVRSDQTALVRAIQSGPIPDVAADGAGMSFP
jgi:hypothetical protein